MKKFSINFATKWICLALSIISTPTFADTPNKALLPEELNVYYDANTGISRKAFKGGAEKLVPTSNDFKEAPGCYVACYSKNAEDSAFSVGDKVYLMGQIRVQGHYVNNLCIPKGYESKDVRTSSEFKDKCAEVFPERCTNKTCWAGSETAYWF